MDYQRFLLAFVTFCVANVAYGRLRKYASEVCVLTGMPAPDKATYHIFTSTGTQRCYLYPGGGSSPGHATFSVVGTPSDKNIIWRVDSANVMITKSDLDTGISTNPQSYAYVHQLDDTQTKANPTGTAVAGQILGKKLGGKNEVQNLFPASALYQADYHALETEIYNCLNNGYASKAYLEWTFYYQTTTSLRPFKITYHATFTASAGATSTCSNMEKIFLN